MLKYKPSPDLIEQMLANSQANLSERSQEEFLQWIQYLSVSCEDENDFRACCVGWIWDRIELEEINDE